MKEETRLLIESGERFLATNYSFEKRCELLKERGDNQTVLTLTTNVGEKQIDIEAFRPKSFVQDTIRTDFSPWQWMYRYDVY